MPLRQCVWLLLIAAIATLAVGMLWNAPQPAFSRGASEPPAVSDPIPTAPIARSARLAGRYAAAVTRVIDGDTVEARVAIWLGQEIITKVRLRGIDAPEISGACGPEREAAIAARDRLQALLAGRAVMLGDVGGDKYFGRVVADLLVDGASSGGILLAEGLARPYGGGRRDAWCGWRPAESAELARFPSSSGNGPRAMPP